MENELRQKARELLESGQVKLVIGYEAGSTPFKCTPIFARTPEDAERLIWNPTCVNNLAVYLPQAVSEGKVAVVVKPCDVKSVVELIKEHQVTRDDVMTIVPGCPGVLDMRALDGMDLKSVEEITWNDGGITVKVGLSENKIAHEQSFADKCLTCTLGVPTLTDVQIGDAPTRESAENGYASVEEYEKMSSEERRAFWAKHFSRCIRCYACREVCPGCFCKECFVDKRGQMWVSKDTNPETNWFYHMTRAMHTAGRCIGCGECERVCPMGIPLSLLGKKLHMEVDDMFGKTPGDDPEALPILGSFETDDPDPCPEE